MANDAATGVERWRTPPSFWGGPGWVHYYREKIYNFYPGGQLEAFEARSGNLLWGITDNFTSPDGHSFQHGGAFDGNVMYAGGTHGLYAVRVD